MTVKQRIDTAALRKLAIAASQDDWQCVERGCYGDSSEADLSITIDGARGTLLLEDARFIAAANPKVLLALLDELDATHEARKEAQAGIVGLHKRMNDSVHQVRIDMSKKIKAAEEKAIHKGWQLVPVEPTHRMLMAYTGGALTQAGFSHGRNQWIAMLTAAPNPVAATIKCQSIDGSLSLPCTDLTPEQQETIRVGSFGAFFDGPHTQRAYTYNHQPLNVHASRIGKAAAMCRPGGDSIDHGLSLLKELQAVGFGVFVLPESVARTGYPCPPSTLPQMPAFTPTGRLPAT